MLHRDLTAWAFSVKPWIIQKMFYVKHFRRFRLQPAEFTWVYTFPVEEEAVKFITWTSRGHRGLFLIFPGAIVLRRQGFTGASLLDCCSVALVEALCVVHTVQWREHAKLVYPALHWANNKRDTKTIFQVTKWQSHACVCECMFVIHS